MPYVKKRSYKKTKPSPKVSKATKTYVAKALTSNKETNYALIDNSTSSISYDSPLLATWTAVAQGTTIDTRVGDRIEPTSLEMDYVVTATGSIYGNVARIILFQWRPDSADEVPTMAKILQIPGTAQSVHSPFILNQTDRHKFKVLFDKTYQSDGSVYSWHGYKNITKFMNKYIQYNTAVATGKSQVYILAYSNVAAAGTEPTFNKVVYFKWKDSA